MLSYLHFISRERKGMFIRQLWVMLKQKNWKGKFIWKCFSIKPTYRGSLLSSFYCFWISELYRFHFCLDLIHQESPSLPRVIIYRNIRYSSVLHMGCKILKENQIQPHTESVTSYMRRKGIIIFLFLFILSTPAACGLSVSWPGKAILIINVHFEYRC